MSDYTSEIEPKTIKELRWQCRRGMLELDILLLRFLEKRYEALAEAEKMQFVDLLSCTDPELYAWLVSRTAEPPLNLENIVNAIRIPLLPKD
jgi:antitoxin CptB